MLQTLSNIGRIARNIEAILLFLATVEAAKTLPKSQATEKLSKQIENSFVPRDRYLTQRVKTNEYDVLVVASRRQRDE